MNKQKSNRLNKSKIVVPTLAILMGASLLGSISGTIAWYQYSTKVTARYTGLTAECKNNLQVKKADGSFVGELNMSDVKNLIKAKMNNDGEISYEPVTNGALTKDAQLNKDADDNVVFYDNISYEHRPTEVANGYTDWTVDDGTHYAQFDLEFRNLDPDSNPQIQVESYVFLNDITIQSDETNESSDIYKAIRVHLSSPSKNTLISATGVTTKTSGKLDINGDGKSDTVRDKDHKYNFSDTDEDTLEEIQYGASSKDVEEQQTTYQPSEVVVETIDETADTSKAFGHTSTDSNNNFIITVTIWFEGWHGYGQNEDEQVWKNLDLTDKKFNVGLTFGVAD